MKKEYTKKSKLKIRKSDVNCLSSNRYKENIKQKTSLSG